MEGGIWVVILGIVGLFLTVLAGIWKVFSSQLDAITKRVGVLESDIVRRDEHVEFAKRLDERAETMQGQIGKLEDTRPTTGELQAVGTGNKEQITKIEDRVGKLEDRTLRG